MYLILRDRPAGGHDRRPTGHREHVHRHLGRVGERGPPIYLTAVLGLSTFAYGFVGGLYPDVTAFVRILGGWLADRADRPR